MPLIKPGLPQERIRMLIILHVDPLGSDQVVPKDDIIDVMAHLGDKSQVQQS
jgi:hypothetical protein